MTGIELNTLIKTAEGFQNASEEEIKQHFVIPLFHCLGYREEMTGAEYPVYSYDRGNNTTYADLIFFNDSHHNEHKQRSEIKWVCDHCLLIVETKKPGKLKDAEMQAKFYTDNTKAIAYITCDGVEIWGFLQQRSVSDTLILNCKVSDLEQHIEQLRAFSYDNLLRIKADEHRIAEEREQRFLAAYPEDISFEPVDGYITRQLTEIRHNEKEKSIDHTGKTLYEILQEINHIILIDYAAAGKTVELKNLAYQLFREKKYIPVYYPLVNYTGEKIDELINESAGWANVDRTVLLLDAVDEIQPHYQMTFYTQLNKFTEKNPECKIVVTTRNSFYTMTQGETRKGNLNPGFAEFSLETLCEGEIDNYVQQQDIPLKQFFEQVTDYRLENLYCIPFYLKYLCTVYKKTGCLNRAAGIMGDIVRNSINMDAEKYINTMSDINNRIAQVKRSLSKTAFYMQLMQRTSITNDEYIQMVTPKDIRNNSYCSLWSKDRDENWLFIHNNFKEYFAAQFLSELDTGSILKIITFDFNRSKVRKNWINTVNYLLMRDDQNELIEWINENDPEVMLYFQGVELDGESKQKVFANILKIYNDNQIYFSSRQSELKAMSFLADEKNNICFLLRQLNPENEEICAVNALRIIAEMGVISFCHGRKL